MKGRIKLLTVFDLTGSNLESDPTWKTYTYCKFPYACDSMEKIESFANDLPILRLLLLSLLPLTCHLLECKQSAPSSMSGLIVVDRSVKMTSSSWLSTDEIQFLLLFSLATKMVTLVFFTCWVHQSPKTFIMLMILCQYDGEEGRGPPGCSTNLSDESWCHF
jgi:hypothetical protein